MSLESFNRPYQARGAGKEILFPQWFGNPKNPPIHFVVFGDSTGANVGGRSGHGVAEMTAARLAEDARYVGLRNLSVPGATTRRARRVQLPKVQALDPDIVLVCLGANDVAHLVRLKVLRKELGKLIEPLVSGERKPLVILSGSPDLGLVPRLGPRLSSLVSKRVERVNRLFVLTAEEFRVEYLDFSNLTSGLITKSEEFFSNDKFHLNERGYEKVGVVVAEEVAAIVARAEGDKRSSPF